MPTLLSSQAKWNRHKPELNAANPPPRIGRREGSALLYAVLGFQVSPRTLESWPLPTRRVNGRATYNTAELVAFAQAKLDATPSIRGGRTP